MYFCLKNVYYFVVCEVILIKNKRISINFQKVLHLDHSVNALIEFRIVFPHPTTFANKKMVQCPNSWRKKRFLIYYFVLRLEFSGGCGETHTSGQEAIALALKVRYKVMFDIFIYEFC